MHSYFQLVEDTPAFCVVYKKPGVSFHSESGPGLFEAVKQQLQAAQLYPVHRLDKVTSGLIVLAKTPSANEQLCEAFFQHRVEKFYLALSATKPSKKQGLVTGDMQPARSGAWKLCKSNRNPAITQFFSKGLGDGLRLFVLRPHTGKTHQLRVALKSLGAPILGDALYGQASAVSDRTYLHAYSLGFSLDGHFHRFTELPQEGQYFLSETFNAALADFAQPWRLAWPSIEKNLAALRLKKSDE